MMEITIKVNNIIDDLKESIAYVAEKQSHMEYPRLTQIQSNGIDAIL